MTSRKIRWVHPFESAVEPYECRKHHGHLMAFGTIFGTCA
jgi:hypothetical protein